MPKRRPEDVLRDIEQSDADDAIARVASMGSEARQSELEAAGFTEAELRAKADAWHARLARAAIDDARARLEAEAGARSSKTPPGRRRTLLFAAAAAAVALVLAFLVFRSVPEERSTAAPSATTAPSATPGTTPPPTAPSAHDAAPEREDEPPRAEKPYRK